jgi:hypothetical protein
MEWTAEAPDCPDAGFEALADRSLPTSPRRYTHGTHILENPTNDFDVRIVAEVVRPE